MIMAKVDTTMVIISMGANIPALTQMWIPVSTAGMTLCEKFRNWWKTYLWYYERDFSQAMVDVEFIDCNAVLISSQLAILR